MTKCPFSPLPFPQVRRAASKCLEAVISTRHELLGKFYTDVSPALICRFKEREENVKVDLFRAYVALLRQTRPAAALLHGAAADDANMMDTDGPVAQLQQQVRKRVNRRGKLVKYRQICLNQL